MQNENKLHITEKTKTGYVDIWYPRSPASKMTSVIIGLVDVRAADSIRVSYDFEKDGWKVEQASIHEWEIDDPIQAEGWKEVAFIQAWGSTRKENESIL